jgi:peptidase C39-like protein
VIQALNSLFRRFEHIPAHGIMHESALRLCVEFDCGRRIRRTAAFAATYVDSRYHEVSVMNESAGTQPMRQPHVHTLARLVVPWRLVLLSIAALAAVCTLIVPPWWAPTAGSLTFTGSLPAADAVHGPALPISLISQYQGLVTDDTNCGPAAVAAVVRYAHPNRTSTTNAALVGAARDATGISTGDTYLPSLLRALSHFGVPSAPLFAADGGGADPLAAIRLALTHGRPVILTVGGAALGRGARYGDHFVLVIGMNAQTDQIDILDPDTQAPQTGGWLPGGRQSWSASLARAAIRAAKERDALAIVIGADRLGAFAPRTFAQLGAAATLTAALIGPLLRLLSSLMRRAGTR